MVENSFSYIKKLVVAETELNIAKKKLLRWFPLNSPFEPHRLTFYHVKNNRALLNFILEYLTAFVLY